MKSATPEVAVVIVNWNKEAQTRHCLETVKLTTVTPARYIIVDNGSTKPLTGLESDVVVLRNRENLGFTGGVNCGLRNAIQAGAEYVWLLNNDAEPLPGALDALVEATRTDPRIGLASAVILNADDEDAVGFHGGIWDDLGTRVTVDPAEYAIWASTSPDRIWLAGTALLVSRRLIEQIGYFDETLFAYWEDNDFSRRSTAAGFRNVVVPSARVRHESGKPAENPEERPPYYYYYMTRNELILMRKTGEILEPRLLYWMLRRTGRLYRRLASLPAQRRGVRRGVFDGLLGRGGAYRE